MREILFRGKGTYSGKWEQGYLSGEPSGTYLYILNDTHTIVTPETVGQYTGLKDRNGVKIFEGDIIKTKFFGKESKNAHHANFNDYDYFEVRYLAPAFFLYSSTREFSLGYMKCKEAKCEIIGNVHDTPELLKGKGGAE